MELTYQTFIGVLRSHLTGQPVQYPDDADWEAVADLARMHSVRAMVYHSLKDVPGVPPEVMERLLSAYRTTVFRDTQFDHLRSQISQGLEKLGAEHVFLRGIYLKHDYPVPALRSMSDIDILVHIKDYDVIHSFMTDIGGIPRGCDDNQRSYQFPGKVLVELHPNLLHHNSPGFQINPGWQYTKSVEGSRERVMTEEGFYLNTVCHLAHHLLSGGTGVRSVMDIWVCRHLRKNQPDRAFVEKELERFGLLRLTENLEKLAEAWFGGGEQTEVTQELGTYILTSGTYGTEQRLLLSKSALTGGKWATVRDKLFPPRKMLEEEFPWCAGKAHMLPAAWAVRFWNKATIQKGMLLRRWGRDNLAQSNADIEAHRQRLCRFGLMQEKD